jgi:hypothetical protein
MPSLIRIQRQEGVPSRVPYGQASPAEFGADVSGALAQGVTEVSRSVLQATAKFQAVEAEKRKQAEADDALMRWSALSAAFGDMDAELKQGGRDAQGNLDPRRPAATWDTYRGQYDQQATRLAQEAIAGAEGNPNIQRLLRNMYTRWRVEAIPAASGYANKLFLDAQGAALVTELPKQAARLAQLAEQEPHRLERETALVEAWLVGKSVVFGEKQTAETLQTFRTDVAWNIARRRLDSDPGAQWRDVAGNMTASQITKMQEYQESKKRQAEAAEKRREAQADTRFREAQKIVQGDDEAAANYGRMTPSRLEAIAAGQDPFYPDPGKARELQRINDSPPFGRGNKTAADTIMAEYATGASTLPRILKARAALNLALSQSDRQEPALVKALDKLQTDERSAESAARGERATRAAEVNANIADAVRRVEALRQPSPGFSTFMQQGERNKHRARIAETKKRAAAGEDPKQIEEEFRQKDKQARDATPQKRKEMQEMAR